MNQLSDRIERFFEIFERSSNTFESDLIASQFGDSFMAADPSGNTRVVKKEEFIAGISKRQAFFQSVGFKFVRNKLLEEKQLDERTVLLIGLVGRRKAGEINVFERKSLRQSQLGA
jgi:hypothetical protein